MVLEVGMSIERELLKKVISGDNKGDFFIPQDLYKDIKASLAQPAPITFKDDADKIAHLENSIELLSGLLDSQKREPLTPRQGLEEYKRGYHRGMNTAIRDLKTKIDSVFNLIYEDDHE